MRGLRQQELQHQAPGNSKPESKGSRYTKQVPGVLKSVPLPNTPSVCAPTYASRPHVKDALDTEIAKESWTESVWSLESWHSHREKGCAFEDGHILSSLWTGKMRSVDSTENPVESLDASKTMAEGVFNSVSKKSLCHRCKKCTRKILLPPQCRVSNHTLSSSSKHPSCPARLVLSLLSPDKLKARVGMARTTPGQVFPDYFVHAKPQHRPLAEVCGSLMAKS